VKKVRFESALKRMQIVNVESIANDYIDAIGKMLPYCRVESLFRRSLSFLRVASTTTTTTTTT